MSREVLAAASSKLFSRLARDAAPTIVWHGGEPTTAPLSWYEHAYAILRPTMPRATAYSLQTNGISLPDRWIDFLCRTKTGIGLSIDGPQRFHDARRRTRAGGRTWSLVMKNLQRLQNRGIFPNVISVLHPGCLDAPEEFYRFYRDNNIQAISFSIDEMEGANLASSFDDDNYKPQMVRFLYSILEMAYRDGYTLYIREVERIARCLTDRGGPDNEQVSPWGILCLGANGDVTTFSPEFMEINSSSHNNFCFGNVLRDDFESLGRNPVFLRTKQEIELGTKLCEEQCRYFGVCGGGAPGNKIVENKSLVSGETSFCRLSIQSAADALIEFLAARGPAGRPTEIAGEQV